MRVGLPLCIIVIGLAGLIAPVHADAFTKPKSPDSRDHLARGNRLYGVRSFEEAVTEYKAGALIEPAPLFDYNLGQCHRALGRYEEAIWYYERFLERGKPEGGALNSVNDFIAQMRGELDKKAMTQKPTEPAPSVLPISSPAAPQAPPPIQLHAERSLSDPEQSGSNWLGWTLAGTGAASMAAAAILFVRASSLNDQANTEPNVRMRNDLHGQADTRATIGAVVGIAGLVIATTGAIYLLVTDRHARTPLNTVFLGIGVSGHGINVHGRF